MAASRSRRAARPARGLWFLLAAVMCAVSLLGTGVAQAAHVHDTPASRTRPMVVAPADQCPLCVASHVATPALVHAAEEPMPRVERVVLCARTVWAPARRWSFELFGRPPPADAGTRA